MPDIIRQTTKPFQTTFKTLQAISSPLPATPDQTRKTNGAPAHRPENRAYFIGSEEARLHGGNIGDCLRVVDSGPARAAVGSARCRRQGARAFYRQAVRFPCLSEHLGQFPARARQRLVQQAVSAMVSPIFPVAPADARVARAAPPACPNRNRNGFDQGSRFQVNSSFKTIKAV